MPVQHVGHWIHSVKYSFELDFWCCVDSELQDTTLPEMWAACDPMWCVCFRKKRWVTAIKIAGFSFWTNFLICFTCASQKAGPLVPVLPAVGCLAARSHFYTIGQGTICPQEAIWGFRTFQSIGIAFCFPDGGPASGCKGAQGEHNLGWDREGHSSATAPHHCCQFRSGKAK